MACFVPQLYMNDHLTFYWLQILYLVLSVSVGQYKYGDETFEASASPSGASYSKCKDDAVKALKVDEACTHMKCSFGGIWNGGGGAGQKNLFVASFFFDRAAEVRFCATDYSILSELLNLIPVQHSLFYQYSFLIISWCLLRLDL